MYGPNEPGNGNDDPWRQEMLDFKMASEAGNITATLDALLFCTTHDVAAPKWLLLATYNLLITSITGADKKKGRGGSLLDLCQQDLEHALRYQTVEVARLLHELTADLSLDRNPDCRPNRATLEEAFRTAAFLAHDQFPEWCKKSEPETVKSSWLKVRASARGRYKVPTADVMRDLSRAAKAISDFERSARIYAPSRFPMPAQRKRPPQKSALPAGGRLGE